MNRNRLIGNLLIIMLALNLAGCLGIAKSYIWIHDTADSVEAEIRKVLSEPTDDTQDVPQPTTTTQPPATMPDKPVTPLPTTQDAIDISTIKWLGDNYSKAVPEPLLISAKMGKTHMDSKANKIDWPDNGGCSGVMCIFYEREGQIVGGKWDHFRTGYQTHKTLENVHGGYHGHTWPADGAKVWMMLGDYSKKKRSNIIAVQR